MRYGTFVFSKRHRIGIDSGTPYRTVFDLSCIRSLATATIYLVFCFGYYSTAVYNKCDYLPQTTSNANSSTIWKSSMALSESSSWIFSMKVLLIRSNVSVNFSSILKWNAGVMIFRRSCHFLPISLIKRKHLINMWEKRIKWRNRLKNKLKWLSPVLTSNPSFSQGLRKLYSNALSIYLMLLKIIFGFRNKNTYFYSFLYFVNFYIRLPLYLLDLERYISIQVRARI